MDWSEQRVMDGMNLRDVVSTEYLREPIRSYAAFKSFIGITLSITGLIFPSWYLYWVRTESI